MNDKNATTPSEYVRDVSAADFEQTVLMRSMEVPVLVDFWAPWCAPCKQLGPILEKLAEEYGGGFELAKINSDDEMQLAAMFGVRSLPTVMLIKGGRPVDGFMGAQPESVIRELLAHHEVQPREQAPSLFGAEPEADEAAQAALDPQAELAAARAAVEREPGRDELKLDLAVALARVGQYDEAQALVAGLPANLGEDERTRRVASHVELARSVADAPTTAELAAQVESDPANLDARHQLGVRLLLEGRAADGLEQFLEMLRRDRNHGDGLPRSALLQAFQVLDDAELVSRTRRRMASLLF